MMNGRVPFADAFDRLQSKMDFRFVNPLWRLSEFLTSSDKDLKLIQAFGQIIVQQRRLEKNKESKSDLLSLFMHLKKEDGSEFSEKELCDHVINFIIAGRDTTAQALSWTVYFLNQNPDAMKKLYMEIDETFAKDEMPSYEKIRGMKYANAVFHESLRLAPSVPKAGKCCLVDDALPDGYFCLH
jgi:cytochrome P450